MHLKLRIQYDGTAFSGSQLQAAGRNRTVQGELESAIERLCSRQIRVALAGRTDSGVHAWGQVASFTFPEGSRLNTPQSIANALNGILPMDVAIIEAEQVEEGFHARFSATSRAYRYLLLNTPQPLPLLSRYSLYIRRPLDKEAMSEAASLLVGTHDMAAFAGQGMGVPGKGEEKPNTVRSMAVARLLALDPQTNYWAWNAPIDVGQGAEGLLALDLVANAFLPQMIRNITGTLLEVGMGRRTVASFREVLEGCDRREAGPTAKPHGLCLLWVDY
ncbi:MAG: tRNA pseudouridine(38-40) synthase TruA [Chloroflexota bacterium]|nr:tRNA pseudouridine(38-40) synthase TruA [Chloroflexota bacterium]